MIWIGIIATLLLLAPLLGLAAWRWKDRRTDRRVWRDLIAASTGGVESFDETMIEGLPAAAQRYFRFMIKPGATLVTAVELDMQGELGLGDANDPKYKPMSARQILAPPYGLVWELKPGAIAGSDGATPVTSWTRFWLFHLVPVVRVGGGKDHHRSAFGRIIAEAAFWAPACLLPSKFVRWEAVNANTAKAIVTFAGFEQAVEITVADDGQPTHVVIQRWSNENPEKEFREQPFGGELSAFKLFGGYMLPTRVVGGNHFGTDDYFPFYKADVTDIRFPPNNPSPSGRR